MFIRKVARGLLLLVVAAGAAQAGERLGPLPPGAISRSFAGPSDEIIGYLAFDPAPVADRLPPGLRFRTLAEMAEGWPHMARYLAAHPDRRGWAWSFFEIVGIRRARYDRMAARFRNGRGGMTVWYPEVVRTDSSDPRPMGEQNLALGSWVSDPRLAAYMSRRGFPAAHGEIDFQWDANSASGSLRAAGISIVGRCRLTGPSFIPPWGRDPLSYETMWTPAGEGDTFEIVTWSGHRSRNCTNPTWQVSGDHPFARALSDPRLGDPNVYRAEFAYGYLLRSGLYRRR